MMNTHPAYSASGSWLNKAVVMGHREGKISISTITKSLSIDDKTLIDTKIDSAIDSLDVARELNLVAVSDYYDGIFVHTLSGEKYFENKIAGCTKVAFARGGKWVWGMADGLCYGIDIASGARVVEKCDQVAFGIDEAIWRIVKKNKSAFIRVPRSDEEHVDIATGAFGVVDISVHERTAAFTLAGGDAMIVSRSGISQRISSEELSGYALRCACVDDDRIVFSCCDREQNIFFSCFDGTGNLISIRRDFPRRKGWTAWITASKYWFIEPDLVVEI